MNSFIKLFFIILVGAIFSLQIFRLIENKYINKKYSLKIMFPEYRKYVNDCIEYSEKFRISRQDYLLRTKAYWQSLNGYEFEKQINALFIKMGYRTMLTAKTNDRGVDIFLEKDNKRFIVQCKAHKNKIAPSVARDLYGTLINYKVDGAFLVTLNGFSEGTKNFCFNKPIELWNVEKIIQENLRN